MNQSREQLFDSLIEMAARYPEWRVGQLVCNLAGWADADVWDVEDEQLLAEARRHIENRGRE